MGLEFFLWAIVIVVIGGTVYASGLAVGGIGSTGDEDPSSSTGTGSEFVRLFLDGEQEPVHEGREFSGWLEDLHILNSFTLDGHDTIELDENPFSRLLTPTDKYKRAAEVMRKIGPGAFPPLLAILRAHDPGAKLSLGSGGGRDEQMLKFYTECAMQAFLELGELAAPIVPELGKRLNNVVAVEALVHIGSAAHAELMGALSHPQPEVRALAAKCFGEDRNLNPQALPALRRCLSDAVPDVRYRAAIALVKMKDDSPALLPELTECARSHTNEITRMFVIGALRDLGTMARSAVPVLLEAYRSGSGTVKMAVAVSISQIDPEAAKAAGIESKPDSPDQPTR